MTVQSTFDQLKSFDIFSEESLQKLLDAGDIFTKKSFDAGAHIIELSADDSDVFFLMSGSVRVLEYTMSGADLELARFSAPGYFGELTAIDDSPRSAEVIALEPCECLVMKGADFKAFLMDNPAAMMTLLERLAQQVRKSNFDFMMNTPL